MSLLTVKDVDKSFRGLHVLRSVSLTLAAGERHVVIGPNGAGKTTLMNTIIGLLPADSGEIRIDGTVVSGLPAHTRVHMGMACTFQKNNLFSNLTVEDNLRLAVTARKPYRSGLLRPLAGYADLRSDVDGLLQEWRLTDQREQKVKELSYGEQRLLEVVLAVASKPRILLLDEPTSGMSATETAATVRIIRSLPRSVALLVIEHDMEVVFAIADRITVLHHGEVFLTGTPEQVRGDGRVAEIYFGGGARPHA